MLEALSPFLRGQRIFLQLGDMIREISVLVDNDKLTMKKALFISNRPNMMRIKAFYDS